MSTAALAGRPPMPPELPDAARPRWPAWYGVAAMGAGTVALFVAVIPLVPVVLFTDAGGALGAIALLVLLVVQDGTYVGTALAFSWLKGTPRAWHFGLRATPPWRTIGIAVAAILVLFGFEFGYIELLGIDDSNVDDLGGGAGVLAAVAVSLAVILVAPVTEELFFRGFFYRALRNRYGVALSALIDGTVFGSLHFEGFASTETLPVIVVFGIGVCLVYEVTGSLFATISIHAAFNTLATVGSAAGYAVPMGVGAAVLIGCLLVPWQLGPAPSAFRARA